MDRPEDVRTTFGPKFFEDVGTDPDKWAAGLRVRLGTDVPSDGVLRDFFEAAISYALLKAREEAFKWQPIETAPKDGSRILTHGDGLVGTSRWVTHFAPAYRFDGEAWYSEQLDRPHLPTEWMPLPPPPAISQHSQKGER